MPRWIIIKGVNDMSNKLSPPVAVCTACRSYSTNPNDINKRCGKIFKGKRCTGTWRSAITNYDWDECPNCRGTGSQDQHRCNQCSGVGWRYRDR